jgi:hypothetical protein
LLVPCVCVPTSFSPFPLLSFSCTD